MPGYEYRATNARRQRAEEFTRRREAADAARSERLLRERKLRAAATARDRARIRRETAPTAEPETPAPPKETPVTPPPAISSLDVSDPPAEFEIFRADPPPINGAGVGEVVNAAREAAAVLRRNPGVWFRIARRRSRSSAASYAGTIRKLDKTIQTRNVLDDDGEHALLYARHSPDLDKTSGKRKARA